MAVFVKAFNPVVGLPCPQCYDQIIVTNLLGSGTRPLRWRILHSRVCLKVPTLLRKTLHSTNPIESMFSTVRHAEGNIKRYRDSRMMQRWLAAVLLYSEKGFKRIKGYASIYEIIKTMEATEDNSAPARKAA